MRSEITFGGIVTKVTQRFNKRGEPFGIVTMEDFEGPGEIALFGEDWGRWGAWLTEGSAVFVTAKCVKRFATSQYFSMVIQKIEYLQTVKDNRLERFTIHLKSARIDDDVVNDVLSMVTDAPGKTELYFNVNDEETNTNVLLRAKAGRIEVRKSLVRYVSEREGMSYTVN